MRPTIRDLARFVNCSITTVSRALDGYPDVAEETRQRIIQAAQEMGYVPNGAARQLRTKQTDTIGFILPSVSTGFSDPYFSEFLSGLGDEASSSNFDLLVTTATPASQLEKEVYQRWVQSGKVDGMVINRVFLNDWRVEYLEATQTPHVSFECAANQTDFVGVEIDSYGGILALMTHLIQCQHRRIGYIGGFSELKINYERQRGYEDGLQQANIRLDPNMIQYADLTPEGGFQAAMKLLSLARRPTAIVCINDLTAIGAMHAAREMGLTVGKEIAISGFDGIVDGAHTQPALTTLDQPIYSIARQLAGMLITMIRNEPLEVRQVKILPRLILRASTGEKNA